jgi:hypothetical protein
MTWEIIFLGALILILGVSAIIMATRTKRGTVTHTTVKSNVDIEKLATAVAKAVGKEIADQLKEVLESLQVGTRSTHNRVESIAQTTIEMDESIIPMKIKTQKIENNLEGMAKEEVKVDKDLAKHKNKLKALLGKKKKKE